MLRRLTMCVVLALATVMSAGATEVAFQLIDQTTVMGVDTLRWRPLRLSAEAPEGLVATVPVAGAARYGELALGVGEGAGRALLLDYVADPPRLYFDANGDGGIDATEECAPVEPGVWEVSVIPAGQDAPRTVLLKLGTGGRMLLAAVRGCRVGALPTPEGPRTVLLLDQDGDGAYSTDGQDQLACDLNGDGRFDPAVERVALRPSVHVGEQEWTVAVTPNGDALTVDERTRRMGRLVASVPLREGAVTAALLTLVRDDGLPLAVREVGVPVELPEGTYRLAGADLKVTDAAGGTWRFPFMGRGGEIVVRPDETTEASVLAPLGCRLSIAGELKPGESVSVTVVMPSAEGLSLGQAMRGGETIAARAWLIDPEGKVAFSADAGFG